MARPVEVDGGGGSGDELARVRAREEWGGEVLVCVWRGRGGV